MNEANKNAVWLQPLRRIELHLRLPEHRGATSVHVRAAVPLRRQVCQVKE